MISKLSAAAFLPSKNGVKGDGGVCLIIGGSEMYTGAPYFAAMAAFRSGCDLVYIFTNNQNLASLCPEAVVCKIEPYDWILRRVTVCIIGCGLGIIDDITLRKIISIVQKLNIPVIIDGDGLRYYETIKKHCNTIILTPNHNEAKKLNVSNEYVVFKGKHDIIKGNNFSIEINEPGSMKRCAGQGDILCGIIAGLLNSKIDIKTVLIISCRVMRRAAFKAYSKYGRSLIASDILSFINEAFEEIISK